MPRKPYNPIDEEIYYPVPARIFHHDKLSEGAKLLAGYLLWCYGKDGVICPKISTICDVFRKKESQIKRWIKSLKDNKIIRVKKLKKSNRYYFIKPKEGSNMAYLKRDKKQEGSNMACLEGSNMTPLTPFTPITRNNRVVNTENNNNVVVSFCEKYGFNFGSEIITQLSKMDDEIALDLLEYTRLKSNDNPNGFVLKALNENWTIPKIPKTISVKEVGLAEQKAKKAELDYIEDNRPSLDEIKAMRKKNYKPSRVLK